MFQLQPITKHMEKKKRAITGIYFRVLNEQTGKYDNICFEDLPVDTQRDILSEKNKDWIAELCIKLAETINRMAEYTEEQERIVTDLAFDNMKQQKEQPNNH